MKKILTILFLTYACILCASATQSQTNYPLTGHPRLFFLSSDEVILKEKLSSNPQLSSVHNVIITECEKLITLPVQQRIIKGKRLLTVSREAIRRICYLSYAYRMTGDTRFAARAETEMLAMAAFSDWNPSHFLDVAEMTLALAIGYDWLYNYLNSTSRSSIASAIKSKGIERSTGLYANQSWLNKDNNWNQVCNAGISAGVAAVYDEDPTYYQTLIDRALISIKIPMGVYKNNGAYPEGMGYWEYGTSFNILFIDMLERMWGSDGGLTAIDGFLKTVNFVTHMQGNASKQLSSGTLKTINPLPFNFGDCGDEIGVLVGMFWLASRSADKTILYNELQKLDFTLSTSEASLARNRLLPFLLIWSMNLNLTNLPPPVETTYMAQGESAVATMRTGWGVNDIYLAVKGGTPSGGHTHMDIGSFVMEAMDVRWAADLGSSNYNNLETNGVDLWNMSQASERWDVFRYNNMAHNTLTFNGNKQLVSGNVPVENLVNSSGVKSIEMDLTPVYKNDVTDCRRTASIVSNRYVEIKDVVTAGTKPLTTRWNLLTKAIPQIVSDKIIKLTQSSKSLYLIFEGTESVRAKTWSTEPSTSFEEQNIGSYFTGFEFSIPAGDTQTITVRLVPAGDSLLNGLDTNVFGQVLNENFESFNLGSHSNDFISWNMNPSSNGSLKAVVGEVVVNPFKTGINTSDKVLRIIRQDDTEYVSSSNSGNFTYRGARAYGYDLRINTSSVVEFKYYKDAPGKVGIRIYDGIISNPLIVDFSDPNENTTGYSTAQWRTAQFAVGRKDLSNFSFSASGYLLISPERNGAEAFQEKELTIYVDDVKMLPLSTTAVESVQKEFDISAFYDPKSERICVLNLPENIRSIRLYDVMGRLLQEVYVFGDSAMLDIGEKSGRVFIVQVLSDNGTAKSNKVVR